MNKILKFLFKSGFLHLKPNYVKHWENRNNLSMVKYAYYNGDFHCRIDAIKALSHFEFKISQKILEDSIYDRVMTVAMEAINILHHHTLSNELVNDIHNIIKHWESKNKEIEENYKVLYKHGVDGLLFDRSQMVRYEEFKRLVNKQKGYMAIG